MLRDFPIAIPGFAPARYVVARDVEAAAFFYGFPEADVSGYRTTYQRQLEAWAATLLTRVVVEPRLTPELVHRLGAGRDALIRRYFARVGWWHVEHEESDTLDAELGELLTVDAPHGPPEDRRLALVDHLRWRVAQPPRVVRPQLLSLSEHTGMLPSDLWCRPISEILFSLKLLGDDEALVGSANWGRG